MQNLDAPLVSVIVPCYNSGAYLKDCLESLQSQTYANFEVLIVDDCSKDNSVDIANYFVSIDERFKLFHNQKNMGSAFTRSQAIRLSKGEFIALMDSDDISFPFRLHLQLEHFKKFPDTDIVGGACMTYNVSNSVYKEIYYPSQHIDLNIKLFTDMPFCNSSLMFRSTCFRELDYLYNEKFAPAEDFELLVRLKLQGKRFFNLQDKLVLRNIHSDSITFSKQDNLKSARFRIIEMQLIMNPKLIDIVIFFYHYQYGGKKLTVALAKNFILYGYKILNLKYDIALLNLHGNIAWKRFLIKVYFTLLLRSIKKLGLLRCLAVSIKNRKN